MYALLRFGCAAYSGLTVRHAPAFAADELETISSFEPQKRGREFQSFFAKLVLREGWEKEEGVRTLSEEMDVMIHKGREFYLIECKWEKIQLAFTQIFSQRPFQASCLCPFYIIANGTMGYAAAPGNNPLA